MPAEPDMTSLLVFDNAPGPEQVQPFVPPAGNGRVLITSRNALCAPGRRSRCPSLTPSLRPRS